MNRPALTVFSSIMSTRHLLALLTVAGLLGVSSGASAQFNVQLAPGFSWTSLSGNLSGVVYGGIVNTPDTDPLCSGFITDRPNHTVIVDERIGMTVRVSAPGSYSSLIIHGPDGVICSGTPMLDGASVSRAWEPGRYSVYLGTSNQWDYLYYDVYFEEDASQLDTSPTSDLDQYDWPYLPYLAVVSGDGSIFPQELSFSRPGIASLDASAMSPAVTGECLGVVTEGPNLLVNVQEGVVYPTVVSISAPADAVLLLRGPLNEETETWSCSTGLGAAANVAIPNLPGSYHLWVGSFDSAELDYSVHLEALNPGLLIDFN